MQYKAEDPSQLNQALAAGVRKYFHNRQASLRLRIYSYGYGTQIIYFLALFVDT